MKFLIVSIIVSLLFVESGASAKEFNLEQLPLVANDVIYSKENIEGVKAIKVTKSPLIEKVDEPTFVRIPDINFTDGTIEVSVLSRLLADAPDYARGFIGIAFRINDDNSAFESMYIRPTNGRTEDIKRRNHATQYFSYPDFKFDRLRQEAPGIYESPADIGLNEWIHLKIVVTGNQASLFINNTSEAALVVNDLKHGAESSGAIGLWVDIGTEGYFSDLRFY